MWSTQVFENQTEVKCIDKQTQVNTTELENRPTPIRNNIIQYISNEKYIYPKNEETVDFEPEPEPEPVFDRPEDKNTIDELPFLVNDDILKEQKLISEEIADCNRNRFIAKQAFAYYWNTNADLVSIQLLEKSSLGVDGWYDEAITNNIGIKWEYDGSLILNPLPKLDEDESRKAYIEGINRLEKLEHKQKLIEDIIKPYHGTNNIKRIEQNLIKEGLLSIVEKENKDTTSLSTIHNGEYRPWWNIF